MNKFTSEMVNDLANKLLIGLTEEENNMVLADFDDINTAMELISNIPNIERIEPMTHALLDTECLLSDDIVEECLTIEEITANTKLVKDNQIVVPKVVN